MNEWPGGGFGEESTLPLRSDFPSRCRRLLGDPGLPAFIGLQRRHEGLEAAGICRDGVARAPRSPPRNCADGVGPGGGAGMFVAGNRCPHWRPFQSIASISIAGEAASPR